MKRKQHSAQFKARVALEATKGQKTVNQLASEYGVHPTQISHWKRQLQEGVPEIFSSKRQKQDKEDEELNNLLKKGHLWCSPSDGSCFVDVFGLGRDHR